MREDSHCHIINEKNNAARKLVRNAISDIKSNKKMKLNAIWIEATGCSGNIISLLDAANPDILYLLRELVNLKYNNSIMAKEGELAYEVLLETLNTEFILIIDGAVSIKDDGIYTIIANYKGKRITAAEAIRTAGEKAKYVLSVGTCASHGGPSAASPNPSGSISVPDFLKRDVIRLPGCPCNPEWLIGTIAQLALGEELTLDNLGRPTLFYGVTIHDRCPRRSYFDNGIFAKHLGEETCMFKLGCRGPVTRTDCPIVRWNDHMNWPIGVNTPCIGCAQAYFPDGMEPFVRY